MMSLQPGPSHRFTLSEATSELLDRHSHLNLTDEVELVDSTIRGHGGFSDVYCGRFIRTGKYAAVKQLRVHIQKEQQLSKNISRELRIWSSLNHPNVLPLLGYALRAGTSFAFICDWIENGTLREYLRAHPETDTFKIVADIAAGLQYLHEQGVIHSDIKSDNVLMSSTGVPMLSDFGVSRVIDASHVTTDTTSVRCSTRWMAYELFPQLDGTSYRKPVTPNERTDVWAFGMTVYEILTGNRPFEDLPNDALVIHAITRNRLPPTPEGLDARPFLDQILWKLCKTCWTKSPSLRPPMNLLSHAIKWEVKPPVDGIKTKQNGVRHFESYLATSSKQSPFRLVDDKSPPSTPEVPDLTNEITCEDSHLLTFGRSSRVFFGFWRCRYREMKVAIKSLLALHYQERPRDGINRRFRRAVGIWHRLDHKNVLPALGMYTNATHEPWPSLVSPWMDNGSLTTYIRRREDDLNLSARLRILLGVASGLAYLHAREVIHGNLTGSNVLIGDDGEALVCDFGISVIHAEFEKTPYRGAARWLAPELCGEGGDKNVTKFNDIYSIGSVMLQVLSGEIPYYNVKNDRKVLVRLLRNIKPERPRRLPIMDAHWRYINHCWANTPEDRPSTVGVRSTIDNFLSCL